MTVPKLPDRKTPRLPRERYQRGTPTLVTAVTHVRAPWFARSPALPRAATEILLSLAQEREARLDAWCWMPEHVHVLVKDADTVSFVRLLKGRIAAEARRQGLRARLWQRSFHDRLLRRDEAVPKAAVYVLANPERRGLVVEAKQYPWSGSLSWPDWREEGICVD